jgi:hypothetical protein
MKNQAATLFIVGRSHTLSQIKIQLQAKINSDNIIDKLTLTVGMSTLHRMIYCEELNNE